MDKIKIGKNIQIYPLKYFVHTDDNDNPEADNDKISGVANSWVF